ncbi:hypothetical protein [Streptomyces aureocirculatus]|uniref:hypothetical protein n=1 Tax=Streptomyces aureocirculatus TaxID=67275 RepID=UPI0012FE80B9|nr:hypothetical protein [Streptomyces aureocirculatus]
MGRPVGDLSVAAPRLLCALVSAAHGAGPHPRIRVIRAVAAGPLRRDLQAAARHLVFAGDLDQVTAEDPATISLPQNPRDRYVAICAAMAVVPTAAERDRLKKLA